LPWWIQSTFNGNPSGILVPPRMDLSLSAFPEERVGRNAILAEEWAAVLVLGEKRELEFATRF
jgi:hypothetical protein